VQGKGQGKTGGKGGLDQLETTNANICAVRKEGGGGAPAGIREKEEGLGGREHQAERTKKYEVDTHVVNSISRRTLPSVTRSLVSGMCLLQCVLQRVLWVLRVERSSSLSAGKTRSTAPPRIYLV